jgi:hypothetical protein
MVAKAFRLSENKKNLNIKYGLVCNDNSFRHCEEGAERLTWQSIKSIQSLNYIYNRKFIFFVIASAHQQHTPYPFVIARKERSD